jgi:hypothetical protein
MRDYGQSEFDQMLDRLRNFDAAWYGNCAGVCWMKQVCDSTSWRLLL